MRILAIETSCDETAISIADFIPRLHSGQVGGTKIKVLSNIVSSQVKLHAKFGGVVPNLAKREHQKNLTPILLRTLKKAELSKLKVQTSTLVMAPADKQNSKLQIKIKNLEKILEREQDLFARIVEYVLPLKPPKIDAIAVTYGPGLEPALWVGINFAKALSYIWGLPIIPVDHMKGHLYSALIQKSKPRNSKLQNPNYKQISNFKFQISKPDFPALALLVSGGHTELILMRGWNKFKIVGETLDDAAGEAFDKVARLLGLGYPGGPAVSASTEKFQVTKSKLQTNSKLQNPNNEPAIKLPRPMINSPDFNFSFSGLKTAVLYLVRDLSIGNPSTIRRAHGGEHRRTTSSGSIRRRIEKLRPHIAAEFQNAVVDVLIAKTVRAAKKYKVKTILLGGGVAANDLLRQRLADSCELLNIGCSIVDKELSGDNALMIAVAAYFSLRKITKNALRLDAIKAAWKNVRAVGNLRLT